jgi:hypothetical protein
MDGPDRLAAMLGLASRWATYREDAELLTILKTIAFVPSWDSSKASNPNPDPSLPSSLLSGCHHNEVVPQYRRADELLSWENEALLETLKGPYQSRYFHLYKQQLYLFVLLILAQYIHTYKCNIITLDILPLLG